MAWYEIWEDKFSVARLALSSVDLWLGRTPRLGILKRCGRLSTWASTVWIPPVDRVADGLGCGRHGKRGGVSHLVRSCGPMAPVFGPAAFG